MLKFKMCVFQKTLNGWANVDREKFLKFIEVFCVYFVNWRKCEKKFELMTFLWDFWVALIYLTNILNFNYTHSFSSNLELFFLFSHIWHKNINRFRNQKKNEISLSSSVFRDCDCDCVYKNSSSSPFFFNYKIKIHHNK